MLRTSPGFIESRRIEGLGIFLFILQGAPITNSAKYVDFSMHINNIVAYFL